MIKVQARTNKEINRVIANFNQKISRLEKLDKEVTIPTRISKKDLMDVSSKAELNRKLNQLKRFSRRGAEAAYKLESGELITDWEKKETGIELRVAKARLTKKIKHLESSKPKIAGKLQVATFAQMGDTQYLNLKAQRERLQKGKIEDTKDILKFRKIAQKILRMGYSSVFRESYKQMLEDIAYQHGYDRDKVDLIMDKIDTLGDTGFLKLFNDDKAIKNVLYFYKTSGLELEDMRENVINLFDEIHGNIDSIIEDYK